MAAPASLLGHGDDPVLGTGNGAPDEQEVALGVHLDHGEPQLGVALGAHVPRHPLALDDAGRIGAGADGARLAVARVAVGRRTAAEAVAVDDALEAAALGGTGDLDPLAGGEDVDLDLGTRRRRLAAEAEDPKHLRRRVEPRLLGVAQLRLGGPLRAARPEAELHSAVAHLHHAAGARLDHRHRHRGAVFREHPGHPELAADQSSRHRYSTLISTSTPAGRSSFVSASIVCGRESLMSRRRLCVRSSNCSRLFLSTCGLRSTVQRSVLTGSGIGPDTCAPVFSAVRTMSAAAWSSTTWSKALRRIRIDRKSTRLNSSHGYI